MRCGLNICGSSLDLYCATFRKMAGNGDEGFSDEDSPALGGRHGGPSSYMGDFRSYASPSSVGGDINGAPDVVMDDLEYNMELFGQRNEALGILQHGMEEELAFIGHRELQMDIIPNLRDNEAEPPSAQPDDMRFVVENVAIVRALSGSRRTMVIVVKGEGFIIYL